MHLHESTNICQADKYIQTTREISDYIGRTFKYGMDTHLSIENMKTYVITQPDDPPENATLTNIRIWEKSVDNCLSRKTILQENMKKSYSLI
jgi:hypothetical protein